MNSSKFGLIVAAGLFVAALSGCGWSMTRPQAELGDVSTQALVSEATPAATWNEFASGEEISAGQAARLPAGVSAYETSDGTLVALVAGRELPDVVEDEMLRKLRMTWASRPPFEGGNLDDVVAARQKVASRAAEFAATHGREVLLVVTLDEKDWSRFTVMNTEAEVVGSLVSSFTGAVAEAKYLAKKRADQDGGLLDIFVLASEDDELTDPAVEQEPMLEDFLKLDNGNLSTDYANGVSVGFDIANVGDRTVKYVRMRLAPKNAVNDYVSSEIGGKSEVWLEVTGPIAPGARRDVYWESVWYNPTIVGFDLLRCEIEYMDGEIVRIGDVGISFG